MSLIERVRKCIFYWENETTGKRGENNTLKGLKFKTNSINEECLLDLFRYIDIYIEALNNYKNGVIIEYDEGQNNKTIIDGDVRLIFSSNNYNGVELYIRKMSNDKKYFSSTYVRFHSSSLDNYKSFNIDIDSIYFEKHGIRDTGDIRTECRKIIKNKYGKRTIVNYTSGLIISHE